MKRRFFIRYNSCWF